MPNRIGGHAYFYVWAFTPLRAGTLLAGALLASLRCSGELPRLRVLLRAAFLAALLVTAGCLLAACRWPGVGVLNVLVTHVAMAPLLIGSGLGCVLTMGENSALNRSLAWAPLRSIGKYSYGMYVFHYIYLPVQVRLLPCGEFQKIAHNGLVGMLLYFAAAVLAAYVVAYASYHLYEKHFLRLKKNFPEQTKPVSSDQ